MEKGDTFVYKGIKYTATDLLQNKTIVKGVGEIEIQNSEGKPEKVRKIISMRVADIGA